MATYTPPGWPAGVHPPGSEEFESTAVGWLLDVVPPDYRLHGVLRRYPVALAAMARYHSRACVEGAREGYRTARTELASALPPHAVDTVLAAYRKEGARLAATARAVGLVERALRGDFAFIKAWKGDRWGNLIYRKTSRNFNPMMATAADHVVAEVEELVDLGQLPPDQIHTPGIFVDAILQGSAYEKRIERRTVRKS